MRVLLGSTQKDYVQFMCASFWYIFGVRAHHYVVFMVCVMVYVLTFNVIWHFCYFCRVRVGVLTKTKSQCCNLQVKVAICVTASRRERYIF